MKAFVVLSQMYLSQETPWGPNKHAPASDRTITRMFVRPKFEISLSGQDPCEPGYVRYVRPETDEREANGGLNVEKLLK